MANQSVGSGDIFRAEPGLPFAALDLHNSTNKMGHKPLTLSKSARTTKEAAQPKEVIVKKHDDSEGAEDDDSDDWSDWNAAVERGVKQSSTPSRGLGQSTTYETSSGAEGEDESDEELQISRADNGAPSIREGLHGLGYTRSPAPNHIQFDDEDGGEEEPAGLHRPDLTTLSGDGKLTASDTDSESQHSSDHQSPAKKIESMENLQESVRSPLAQRTPRASARQPLHSEEAFESELAEVQHVIQHDENLAPGRPTTSDQDTSSPSSIFDNVQDSPLMDSNLRHNAALKRKRRTTARRVSGPEGQPTRKRRKRSVFSPPTSVPPDDEEVSRDSSPDLRAVQGRFRINRPSMKSRSVLDQIGQDQGSMTAWVKPLSLNSSLKHPLFNPSPTKNSLRSRGTDLAARKRKATASSTSDALRWSMRKSQRSEGDLTSSLEGPVNESPSVRKKSRDHSSPPKINSKAQSGVGTSSSPSGRKRSTRLSSIRKSVGRTKPGPSKTSAVNDYSEEEVEQHSMDGSESGSSIGNADAEANTSAEDSSAPKELACRTCNRKFRHEKQLQSHKKNNSAHPKSYECWKCGDEFDNKTSLLRHQSRKGHPRETFDTRRTGPFSEDEIHKLEQFMMNYCDEHGIDETVFRQMMTDSSRRGRNATWSWPWVTRFEFLNEYYDVLPHRAHKSMLRYKERNFQNLDHKREWTEEEDKLLVDLVNELGPKWIEIGLRLSRTQDSVTQRYKKKLKDRDAARSGPWSDQENDALKKAIEDIKDELSLTKTADTDENISWCEVSKRMGGIRTAHQCSTHWHRVQRLGHKSRRRGAKVAQKVKSKEFVSSDTDEDPRDVESDQHREQFLGVFVPKDGSKTSDQAKPKYYSEPDSPELEPHQNKVKAKRRPCAASRVRSSSLLGSSVRSEQNTTPSPLDSRGGDSADTAEPDDNTNEPLVATADEWERILRAEGQSLSPIVTRDIQNGIPRNLLNKKTPNKLMALTQVFEQTQASTSPRPNGIAIPASSSSRPSPDIRMKLRLNSSLELGTSQQQGGRQRLAADADDVQVEELSDSSSESDNDANMKEVKRTGHNRERHADDSSALLGDSGTEDSDREEGQVPVRSVSSGATDHDENSALVHGESETGEGDDTSAGNNESNEGSEGGEEISESEEDESEDSNDSMVEDTHNDFMVNVKESAKSMSQRTPVTPRKINEESDDEFEWRHELP